MSDDSRRWYSEKLRDPRWQKKRLEIFNRDDWRCMKCGDATSTLHVHHTIEYIHGLEPWDYPNETLLTVCWSCHRKEHDLDLDEPGFTCIICGEDYPLELLAGRNGKHEPICEDCAMGMERGRDL